MPHDPLLAAIEVLKAMDRDGARALRRRPPASFLPAKWRKLILATARPIDACYETAMLATVRDRLRGSDIWVESGSGAIRSIVV